MDEMTPPFPQLLRGLGPRVPALAKKMPVKLARLLVGVGFQGKENLCGPCLPSVFADTQWPGKQPHCDARRLGLFHLLQEVSTPTCKVGPIPPPTRLPVQGCCAYIKALQIGLTRSISSLFSLTPPLGERWVYKDGAGSVPT